LMTHAHFNFFVQKKAFPVLQLPAGQAVSNTGHPIDIAHNSLELLSDPPTAASQAAGITGTRHHTGLLYCSLNKFITQSSVLILLGSSSGLGCSGFQFLGSCDSFQVQRGRKYSAAVAAAARALWICSDSIVTRAGLEAQSSLMVAAPDLVAGGRHLAELTP
uniref:Uncharacterized protein n=1 Tax=Chelydra serpentina TaxID=8475 RepID=A0A8C3XNE4_CHESE